MNEPNQLTKDVARIIWPEALDGETAGGRVDEAKAYDMADEVIDEVMAEAGSRVRDRLQELLSDHYVVEAQYITDLRECIDEGDLNGTHEAINRFDAGDAWVESVEIELQRESSC